MTTGTSVLEVGGVRRAGLGVDHGTEGTGQHHLAGAQRLAGSRRRRGEPGQRLQRVAEAGGARAGRDDSFRRRRCGASTWSRRMARTVEGRAARRPRTKSPDGAVVGDRVSERDVPAGDPAVDDLERSRGVGDRCADGVRGRRPGSAGPAPSTKAISASTCGWSSRSVGTCAAVGHVHVVEEDAEVGLVHAELLLDGLLT